MATGVFPATDAFAQRHIGPSEKERDDMLETLGLDGRIIIFHGTRCNPSFI